MTIFLALILTGCSASETAAPAKLAYSFRPDEVVLQIYSPGWRSNPQPVELLPEVTLWGDGRVLFGAADGSLEEGRLSDSNVQRLVAAATVLYSLPEQFEDVRGTDLPRRTYSVRTSQGQRSVTVIWPPELQGPLTGDAAKRAADLAPIGQRTVFRMNGTVRSVLVLPDIPLLQN